MTNTTTSTKTANEFGAIVMITGIDAEHFEVPGAENVSQPVVAFQYGKGTAAEHGGYLILGPTAGDADDVIVEKLLGQLNGDTIMDMPSPIMMYLQGMVVVPFDDEMVRGVDVRELFQFREPTEAEVAQAAKDSGSVTVH